VANRPVKFARGDLPLKKAACNLKTEVLLMRAGSFYGMLPMGAGPSQSVVEAIRKAAGPLSMFSTLPYGLILFRRSDPSRKCALVISFWRALFSLRVWEPV
jgi:hypothetical protein